MTGLISVPPHAVRRRIGNHPSLRMMPSRLARLKLVEKRRRSCGDPAYRVMVSIRNGLRHSMTIRCRTEKRRHYGACVGTTLFSHSRALNGGCKVLTGQDRVPSRFDRGPRRFALGLRTTASPCSLGRWGSRMKAAT